MKSSSLRLASAAFALASASAAFAATVPYTETFSSTLSGWTTTGSASWSQNTATGLYTATTSTAGAYLATVQASNFFTGTTPNFSNFTVSTTFTVTDGAASAGQEYYGIALFGNAASPGTLYLADVQRSGPMRIISLGGTNSDFVGGANSTASTLAVGTTYTLQVDGTYTGNALSMTLSLFTSGGVLIRSTTTASDATPLTGQYFGFRNNLTTAGDAVSVSYDSFSITSAVPEPSSFAALAGLATLGVVSCRRRRVSVRR